ncbi:manganese catalase family protein [Salinimicrobium sediminilitoris]|uniref:manganese catalase family protein n=1 Tax=Salinimicrobium sediminilitoris TaxID=2876715 RepID=UPI001E33B1AB|nr:manganese catalase family protein [Salinimicrobium sediminilitoris]MCC8360435.1 manganese catalase family protein [Salinimicrobium sediminilitoris]
MFYHVKELQFNARVSKPDPAFATLLLEQFGGANGELKAALQYFVQAFAVKQVHPDKYDLLMDIATEEFSHLEIVGATIQMLLKGIHGDLKNAAEESEIMELLKGKASKEGFIHNAMVNPQFFNLSGGGPTLSDSNGNPWTSAYVTANGDLTVDLRSNIAAESRAKIVYEYLMQHTSDPHIKDTLRFLMTREVAHFQMFQAALETIEPNFPPGVLQSDPKYSNKYFNLSNGEDVRGPWNEGKSPELGETWEHISDPIEHVRKTKGMTEGHDDKKLSRDPKEVDKKNKELSKKKYEEIKKAMPKGEAQWSKY